MRKATLACVTLMLMAGASFATSYTWDGGATGTWQTDAKWNPDATSTTGPGATDDVNLESTVNNPIIITSTGNIEVNNLTMRDATTVTLIGTFSGISSTRVLTCDTDVFTADMVGATINCGTNVNNRLIQSVIDSKNVVVSAMVANFSGQANATVPRPTSLNVGGANTLTINGNFYDLAGSAITAKEIITYGNVLRVNAANSGGPALWKLYGTGKSFRDTLNRAGTNIEVYGTGIMDNGCFQGYSNTARPKLTVKSGGTLGTTTATGWQMYGFVFEDGQANLPAWKTACNFKYLTNGQDNGSLNTFVTGGIIYPNNVLVTNTGTAPAVSDRYEYWNTYRVKGGSFKLGGTLTVTTGGAGPSCHNVFSTEDVENLGTYEDFDVALDILVGYASGAGLTAPQPILKLNSSTVHVGRDLIFGWRQNGDSVPGTADLGSATIYVGRNLFMYDPAPASYPAYLKTLDLWDAGASTIICDGNGISLAQSIATYSYKQGTTAADRIALHNLVIRNPGGTVSLSANGPMFTTNLRAGELYLTGDLRLERGIFNDSDRAITFNGPNHTLFWDNNLCKVTGNSLDNIILLPDAVLYLDAGTHSIVKMDNIDMQTGSKLYLSGFTLTVEGTTFVSAEVSASGEPYTAWGSNGTLYGTLAVPEPATLLLMGTGALGVLGYIRRRRMA